MPVLNSITEISKDMTEWRRYLHSIPELSFNEIKTAKFISSKLSEWGIKHEKNIAKTGIVAQIKGKKGNSTKTIGLRADIDALPIHENNNIEYKSTHKGVSHKCGHDGHTTLLLGAAKYLSENPDFDGTVNFIFQPAEEGGGGANEMIKDGLLEKFPMSQVFGMHNWPDIPKGKFSICSGPIMAAVNTIQIKITGRGGHAAMPHQTIDPIIISSQIVTALQTITSRTIDPIETIVLSITQFHSGTTHNIIPDEVFLEGTLRTFSKDVENKAIKRIKEITENIAKSFLAKSEVSILDGYPATINSQKETDIASNIASEIVGKENVESNMKPIMGSEDFSFMLNKIPGAFIFVGQGDEKHNKPCHHAEYDFNDEILPIGTSYWIKLVKNLLK
tara:strand:- start:598 stop:1767 length:1170 start_codon:yes stop_codon:yes gene_type:complete